MGKRGPAPKPKLELVKQGNPGHKPNAELEKDPCGVVVERVPVSVDAGASRDIGLPDDHVEDPDAAEAPKMIGCLRPLFLSLEPLPVNLASLRLPKCQVEVAVSVLKKVDVGSPAGERCKDEVRGGLRAGASVARLVDVMSRGSTSAIVVIRGTIAHDADTTALA